MYTEELRFYIIKWTVRDKPIYQFGRVLIQNGKSIPKHPENFTSLNFIFINLKRHHRSAAIYLHCMGLDPSEKAEIYKIQKLLTSLKEIKFVRRPYGKKASGEPIKTFLVDSEFAHLKAIRSCIIREYFEIVGLAGSAQEALNFLKTHLKKIDLIIANESISDGSIEQLLLNVQSLRPQLNIILTGKNSTPSTKIPAKVPILFYVPNPMNYQQFTLSMKNLAIEW